MSDAQKHARGALGWRWAALGGAAATAQARNAQKPLAGLLKAINDNPPPPAGWHDGSNCR